MSDRHFWAAGTPRLCSTENEHHCGDCACCGEEYNANHTIIWVCGPTGALVDEGCWCPDWTPLYKRYGR